MLSIGEFSKICMVSSKTLRYYDEIGLLKPMCTGENGYRYYAVAQLRTMLLISKLKGYSFSLDEIAALLEEPSGLADALACQRNILLARAEIIHKLVDEISTDLIHLAKGEDIMSYINSVDVTLVKNGPINILSSRQKMSVDEYGKYYGRLYERIAREHLTVTGVPVAVYHDKEFSHESNDTELGVQIKEDAEGTRILPEAECAMAVHKGPYGKLNETYARIQEWMDAGGYVLDGPPREIYVGDKPDAPVVEVYCPVRKA